MFLYKIANFVYTLNLKVCLVSTFTRCRTWLAGYDDLQR